MAQISGQYAELWVSVSGVKTKAAGLRNWSISIASEKIDATAAGDGWTQHIKGIKSWEGEAEMVEVDAYWFDLVTGDNLVEAEFYVSDSTEEGTVYYSGTVSLDAEMATPYNDLHGITVTFTGSDALTKSVVTE